MVLEPNAKELLKNIFEVASERLGKLRNRFKNDPSFFEKYKEGSKWRVRTWRDNWKGPQKMIIK